MQLALVFVLVQAAQPMKLVPIFERRLDDTTKMSIAAGESDRQSGLEIRLLKRGRMEGLMARLVDPHLVTYRVLRADDSSVVIGRAGFYTIENSIKFFIDRHKRTVVKRIEYTPDIGLAAVDDREVAAVLDVPPAIVKRLGEKRSETHGFADTSSVPKKLRDHPMPQSTYTDFARARPKRVEDGYGPEDTIIEEAPGPYQIVGPRIWFGKIFYDGEGTSGVGGLGYFDTATSKYGFVRVPGLADWSVSALMIEDQTAWIGLVGYPEGAAYSGGLLQYDLKSGVSGKFSADEIARQIVRWKDRLLVGTTNGAYEIWNDILLARYRVEPNIDNRFIIVREVVSLKPRQVR
jgi:hypothetical protein